jgi:hypothetical protein
MLVAALSLLAVRNSSRLGAFLKKAWCGLGRATAVGGSPGTTPHRPASRSVAATFAFRSSLVAGTLLAAVQWADGVQTRLREWPVYRLRAGVDVLPNMSESNRDVIRYLQTVTPADARILVVSDQKLFFLSYYLSPRRILHKMHPASEHVVPQPNQQRQLPAYRLDELTASDIERLHPDYVLEYFEGPGFVEPDRLLQDRQWIAFLRERRADPAYVPSCNVILRPFAELERQP